MIEFRNNFILDGAFGTEAESRSKFSFKCFKSWSSSLLLNDPSLVTAIHKDYLISGSEIISTNTFQAEPTVLATDLSISLKTANELMQKSVDLVKNAIHEFRSTDSIERTDKNLFIAGSLGPYGSILNDGSEYSGNYVDAMETQAFIRFHQDRLGLLVKSGVDMIAWETFPALKEIQVALQLSESQFSSTGVAAWISLNSFDGEFTCHGEKIEEIARTIRSYKSIFGIGVNCGIRIKNIPKAFENIIKGLGEFQNEKTFIVYPNSGEIWNDGLNGWIWPDGSKSTNWAPQINSIRKNIIEENRCVWVGGCCRVTPDQIKQLTQLKK